MHTPRAVHFLLAIALSAVAVPGWTQDSPEEGGYLVPPPAIVDIVDAPATPTALVSPRRDMVAFSVSRGAPPIGWLARPMHRLAGFRIDPRNSGPWQAPAISRIELRRVQASGDDTSEDPVQVLAPRGTTLGWPRFSPDGRHLSYAVIRDTGIELWAVDLDSGQPRPLTSASLNATGGNPCEWLADSSGVLCRFRMSARGAPPEPPRVPDGPDIREASGNTAGVRTYQDLLSSRHDEALFEYHFTSQVATVALATGSRTAIGEPGLYARVSGAPDSRHLLIERLTAPWSRMVPASRFARSIEVWTPDGDRHEIATRPVADSVPIGGVVTGPRAHRWHASEPATLVWTEAQDGGDPQRSVSHRDIVYTQAAPFMRAPREIARTEYRFASIAWTEDGTAFITERDRETRWTRSWLRYPGGGDLRRLFDRSSEDRYGDPGTPMRRATAGVAARPIRQDGDTIYVSGAGASDDGDRPFIDALNLTTLKRERLFHTALGSYETVVGVLAPGGDRLLTRRESPTDPPNYVVRDRGSDEWTALTDYADPAPVLREVEKRLMTYEREDGVSLSAVLYLPPGYQPGTPAPLLMWAYPREFTSATAAGQVRGSPYRFTTIRGASHLLLLTEGYAILDGPAMPIIGEGETANDTYVPQLVANARAAIDAVVEQGVADPNQIAIGGHSYGAFMTANLLAHSDLFRAGIARSGAYNRTLTPFGFQNERRTFWEAPDVYGAMSPFFHADAINEPILLTHGEVDNNTGTFPIQSERLYHALKGHGATVRYVTLPHESHGYVARESILHVATEMLRWCETYLGAPASNE